MTRKTKMILLLPWRFPWICLAWIAATIYIGAIFCASGPSEAKRAWEATR